MGGAPLAPVGPIMSNVYGPSQADAHRNFQQQYNAQMQAAASRVRKSDWEAEQDRKDQELDEWLEASQQAVERARDD